jgi:mono/diheme cytochrome c family protein
MRLSALSLVVVAAALSASTAGAQDVPMGDPQAGLALARQTCTACHQVERGQNAPVGRGQAPSFTAVANTRAMTARALHVFLFTPHPTMPNLILSAAEADDVSAYILSLRDPR